MKTTAPIQRLLPVSACLLFAVAAVSCQSTAKPPVAVVQQPVMRKNWVKVSSQPPTYYPKDVAADSPTDHWSGEWVDTGDDHGTRYFIPFRELGGIDRQRLVNEALSARSARKLAAIAAEDEEIRLRNIRNVALYGPPVYAGLLLAAMGGATSFEIDVHRLEKEWYGSKGLH